MVEADNQTPSPEAQKQQIIDRFYASGYNQDVYDLWLEHSKIAFHQVATFLAEDQIAEKRDEIPASWYLKNLGRTLRTLNGTVFEHLSLAYLKNELATNDLDFLPLTTSYRNIISTLAESGRISVVHRDSDPYFSGVQARWDSSTVVIPDALVLQTEKVDRLKIVGVVESTLDRPKTKGTEGHWLFTELLREYPSLLRKLSTLTGQNMSGFADELEYYFVTSKNSIRNTTRQASEQGFTKTVITPITYKEVIRLTIRLVDEFKTRSNI